MEILIINNRINKKLKPKYKNLGKYLKFNFTYITTDFDLTTQEIGNQKYKGVVAGDDLYDQLRTIVPEGKYDLVIFYYGNTLKGVRVNYAPYQPLYVKTLNTNA